MNTKILVVASLAISSILAGCASVPKGSHSEVTPVQKKLTAFSTLSVSATTSIDEAKEAIPKIEKAIAEQITKTLSSKKLAPRNEAQLHLRVKVTDYKQVGKAARFFVGLLAGSDLVAADVVVFDSLEKKPIGSFKAQGEWTGADLREDGTDVAISELAREVAKYLKARE